MCPPSASPSSLAVAHAPARRTTPPLSLVCVRSTQSTPPTHTHPTHAHMHMEVQHDSYLDPPPAGPARRTRGAHAAACAACVERRIHPEQTQQETCKRNGQRPALLSYQSELGSARELPLTPRSRLRGRGSLLRFLLPWSSQRGRTPAHRNRAPAPDSRVRRAKRN